MPIHAIYMIWLYTVNSKLNDLLRLHFLSEKGAGGVNVVKTVDF